MEHASVGAPRRPSLLDARAEGEKPPRLWRERLFHLKDRKLSYYAKEDVRTRSLTTACAWGVAWRGVWRV